MEQKIRLFKNIVNLCGNKEAKNTGEVPQNAHSLKWKALFYHCLVQYESYAGTRWPSLVCPDVNDILQKASAVVVNMEELTRVNHSGIL